MRLRELSTVPQKKKQVQPESKKKISGRNKGAAFERDIARKLSLWITGGASHYTLHRSTASGGRSTTLQKKGIILGESAGDLQAIQPEGEEFIRKYFIECKAYIHLQWANLIVGGPCRALEFYKKATEQAAMFQKIPLMIAKQNRLPVMVMMPITAANDLDIKTSVYPQYQDAVLFPMEVLLATAYGMQDEVELTRPRLTKRAMED